MLGAIIVGIAAFFIILTVQQINKAFGAKVGPGEAVVAGGCGLVGVLALVIIWLLLLVVLIPALLPLGVIGILAAVAIAAFRKRAS